VRHVIRLAAPWQRCDGRRLGNEPRLREVYGGQGRKERWRRLSCRGLDQHQIGLRLGDCWVLSRLGAQSDLDGNPAGPAPRRARQDLRARSRERCEWLALAIRAGLALL
jgi:hypothetical protein